VDGGWARRRPVVGATGVEIGPDADSPGVSGEKRQVCGGNGLPRRLRLLAMTCVGKLGEDSPGLAAKGSLLRRAVEGASPYGGDGCGCEGWDQVREGVSPSSPSSVTPSNARRCGGGSLRASFACKTCPRQLLRTAKVPAGGSTGWGECALAE